MVYKGHPLEETAGTSWGKRPAQEDADGSSGVSYGSLLPQPGSCVAVMRAGKALFRQLTHPTFSASQCRVVPSIQKGEEEGEMPILHAS